MSKGLPRKGPVSGDERKPRARLPAYAEGEEPGPAAGMPTEAMRQRPHKPTAVSPWRGYVRRAKKGSWVFGEKEKPWGFIPGLGEGISWQRPTFPRDFAVASALEGFTAEFGMESGGAPPL